MKKPKTVMTMRARHKLNMLLQELLMVGGAGTVSYPQGWNDARVAEKIASETGEPVREHHVAGTRIAVFGKIHEKTKPENNTAAMESRIAVLEKTVRELCSQLGYEPA